MAIALRAGWSLPPQSYGANARVTAMDEALRWLRVLAPGVDVPRTCMDEKTESTSDMYGYTTTTSSRFGDACGWLEVVFVESDLHDGVTPTEMTTHIAVRGLAETLSLRATFRSPAYARPCSAAMEATGPTDRIAELRDALAREADAHVEVN